LSTTAIAPKHLFDPGPVAEPFASLVAEYPGTDVYPAEAFRVEWGPIFHRGRLDGSARLLVIGQDPAQSEVVVRRILVGEAGHRSQGLMAKLGIDRSYVMVNTFLYSVYGQGAGEQHASDAKIVEYRNRWLDAVFSASKIEAVLALGHLADGAWTTWKATPAGKAHSPAYQHVTHPTQPESSSGGDPTKLQTATKTMLANWNAALAQLHPLAHPDVKRPLVPYGEAFAPGDRVEIPEADMPGGVPDWMRSPNAWASRVGATAAAKRRNITITIPAGIV
jgi:uracil-DNA glycosylase